MAQDGTIYEGREIIYKGSHVYHQNTGKIGIVCLGHFDASMLNWFDGVGYGGEKVNSQTLAALRRLCHALIGSLPIRVFGGHMEYGVTESCPGSNLMPFVKILRTEFKLSAPTFRKLD